MRDLNIIMPMGGLGSRFKKNGFLKPKPLIEIEDTVFYKKALSSLIKLPVFDNISFIVRNIDDDGRKVIESLTNNFPSANTISINHLTSGALETCMAAQDLVSGESAVLILDCDLWFQCNKFESFILDDLGSDGNICGGAVTFFESNDSKYSYAEIKNNIILRTAEKNVISNSALIGAYYFSRADLFFINAKKIIMQQQALGKESYTSLLFNLFISGGLNVYGFKADSYCSFGTPEEYNKLKNI